MAALGTEGAKALVSPADSTCIKEGSGSPHLPNSALSNNQLARPCEVCVARAAMSNASLAGSTMITVEEINDAWGWMGLRAVEILGANAFGNLMLRDADGSYWRLRPQDLCCEPVADNRAALDALSYNQDFLNDWYMPELTDDRSYCLKIPSALGGHYGSENLAIVPLSELIRFSGEGAQHLEGLPRWG
jgi:hypothetical protein